MELCKHGGLEYIESSVDYYGERLEDAIVQLEDIRDAVLYIRQYLEKYESNHKEESKKGE